VPSGAGGGFAGDRASAGRWQWSCVKAAPADESWVAEPLPVCIEPLARAGTAVGVDGIFLEVHDNPAKALSDGTNALPLSEFRPLLQKLLRLAAMVREWDTQQEKR